MKKYLLSFFVIAFIVPSIAFASWWNPFSWHWFIHKNQITTESTVTKTETPITVQSPTNTISNLPKNDKTSIPPIKPKETHTITTPTPSVDVCKNIEGIQTSVPLGMTATGNVCSIKQVVQQPIDICLNIEGIQTTVPSGMILQNGNCSTPIPVIPLPISVDLRISSANSITDTSATLRANLISGAPANVSFTYNQENSDVSKTTPVVYQFNNENFSAQISGLKPNTTYEFYASAYNGSSDRDSALLTFTTPLAPGTCVAGQHWDTTSDTCIPTPTCPTGQTWCPSTNKCFHLTGCGGKGVQ